MKVSRRELMGLALVAPIATIGFGGRASASACYDPASLPANQRSLRRSLGFEEQAPDAAKRCELCAFYTGVDTGCGKCMLLSGGAVTAASTCASWAAKG